MATWSLICKRCSAAFVHSQIPENIVNYFLPVRPKFPPDGLDCECLNCKTTSRYQRNELIYER